MLWYELQIYAWLGVEPPRGVLLHGPPGCGKTALANAIANECGVPFLRISAPEIVSGMSGELFWENLCDTGSQTASSNCYCWWEIHAFVFMCLVQDYCWCFILTLGPLWSLYHRKKKFKNIGNIPRFLTLVNLGMIDCCEIVTSELLHKSLYPFAREMYRSSCKWCLRTVSLYPKSFKSDLRATTV